MIEINGKEIAKQKKEELKLLIEKNSLKTTPPFLACVLVGDDEASKIYVASKEKQAREVGILSMTEKLKKESTFEEVKDAINKLNNNPAISAILLQLPLPPHLAPFEEELVNTISPEKDADGLTYENLGKLFYGNNLIAPCTADGIMELLEQYNINPAGKQAVIIGRSNLVGKSVAMLLLNKNATPTICHSQTTNLKEITKQADILIVAIGKPKFITADMVKPGAVIIDVGINRIKDKTTNNGTKIVGDVDYDNVKSKCFAITPVPGGVGPQTIRKLLENTQKLHMNNFASHKQIVNKTTQIKQQEELTLKK